MSESSTDIQCASGVVAPVICPWPDDKQWVYSITFDEALSELHRYAIPMLDEFGVPGHVEVVVGQMGQVRHIGASSYNGFRHMSAAELRRLLEAGWGVGNHSWSHELITPEMVERELGQAKEVLEQAIGQAVTVYCAPGSNHNMSAHVLEGCRRLGYLAAMSITDALNRPAPADAADNADPLWLNRTFLHTQGYEPFYSEFDPFRNIAHARRERGWIIDYCHCPLEKAVHVNKDCSAAELRQRLETVCAEGGQDVWLARVEDAVDYRYTRRAARVRPVGPTAWRIESQPPPAVRRRMLTLGIPVPISRAWADGVEIPIRRRHGRALVNLDLHQARTLVLESGQERRS